MKKRKTLAEANPELAKQWHPTKNGALSPTDVTCGSGKTVWWRLQYYDERTEKLFDFEWKARISHRVKNVGCPYLSGKAVWPGYNDLMTINPELAAEWHPVKNNGLKPTEVNPNSNKKVWWYLSYTDTRTGKHFGFEWKASIANRNRGDGCPFLSGHAVWPGFNDLESNHPDLAMQWHPTLNGELKPTRISCRTRRKVWWYLSYTDLKTGKMFEFEWKASVIKRVDGDGCPYLSGYAVQAGFNDLASNFPELAKEWHPTKNRNLTPDKVYEKDSRKRTWYCLRCGNTWRATVRERTCDGRTCAECKKNKDFML